MQNREEKLIPHILFSLFLLSLSLFQRHCIAVIHPENKQKLLDLLDQIEDVFSTCYSNDEDWPALEDKIKELRQVITDAKEEGEEGKELIMKKQNNHVTSLLKQFSILLYYFRHKSKTQVQSY